MRNGFTKIPNNILDQPWARNPTVVYLYTWLSLNADLDGNISISLNSLVDGTGLTKKQVRNALSVLLRAQFVAQTRAQIGAHSPSLITICFLGNYKSAEDAKGTDKGTDEGTLSRVYKNDNIISYHNEKNKKTNKNIPPLSPKGETEYDWSVVPEDIRPIVEEWLQYKKEKKQTYKPVGFKAFIKKLCELSGNDAKMARLITEQSMASNYSGIFELKRNKNGTTQKNQGPGNESDHPSDSELLQQSVRIMQRFESERNARQAAVRQCGGFPEEGKP